MKQKDEMNFGRSLAYEIREKVRRQFIKRVNKSVSVEVRERCTRVVNLQSFYVLHDNFSCWENVQSNGSDCHSAQFLEEVMSQIEGK